MLVSVLAAVFWLAKAAAALLADAVAELLEATADVAESVAEVAELLACVEATDALEAAAVWLL
tara:strand:+ start:296 stop:484 length:189 start_codon:yes stop_codon:yes gene_type:complete